MSNTLFSFVRASYYNRFLELVLFAIGIRSLILYGVNNNFHYGHWNSCHKSNHLIEAIILLLQSYIPDFQILVIGTMTLFKMIQ